MQNNIAVVSLKNICYNARQLYRAAGNTPVTAVVKDDAYGHGAPRVALALQSLFFVSAFAVATVDEGAELKCAGIDRDVLVLTPPLGEDDVLRGAAYGLILTLSSLSTIALAARTAKKYSLFLRAHLAVNTGMNRYGLPPMLVERACREAFLGGISVEGVYSHLFAPHDQEAVTRQRELFERAASAVRERFPSAVRHLAATGGIFADPALRYDAVRAGIGLYGYLPRGFEGIASFKPAMKVYTHVVQSGKFTGGGVGYAPAEREYRILQAVRLGYGDGYFRAGIDGGIGNLCMDAYVREGEGRRGQKRLAVPDISAYAKAHGTTEYEVLVNIARRAEKVYL